MKKWMILLLTLALVPAGCSKKSKMDSDLSQASDVMLKVAGKTVFSADAFQTQFSRQGTTLRAGNDDMSAYMSVACDVLPSSVGQSVTADLGWKQNGAAQTHSGGTFTVQKIEGELVWLWSSSDKAGAVVRVLE